MVWDKCNEGDMYSILEKDRGRRIALLEGVMIQILLEDVFQWKLTRKEGHFRERTANA